MTSIALAAFGLVSLLAYKAGHRKPLAANACHRAADAYEFEYVKQGITPPEIRMCPGDTLVSGDGGLILFRGKWPRTPPPDEGEPTP